MTTSSLRTTSTPAASPPRPTRVGPRTLIAHGAIAPGAVQVAEGPRPAAAGESTDSPDPALRGRTTTGLLTWFVAAALAERARLTRGESR